MPTLEQLLAEAYGGSPNNPFGRPSGLSLGRNYSEPIPLATQDLPRPAYLEELFNQAAVRNAIEGTEPKSFYRAEVMAWGRACSRCSLCW